MNGSKQALIGRFLRPCLWIFALTLAFSMGIEPPLILAAIMSGVTVGCNLCFYTDPVFMTAASTGVSNLKIIGSTLPYALCAALLSALLYLLAGIIM